MIARRIALLAALLPAAACHTFDYEDPSPFATSDPTSVGGVPVPGAAPIREPFTTYLQVRKGENVLGYVVRYDPIPLGQDVKRVHREGTMFVEDIRFERIGFITNLGRGYRYRGAEVEEIGQGSLNELLGVLFEDTGFELTPLR